MECHGNNDQRYAIILAGGDGNRLSSLTCKISGQRIPKQFCNVIGETAMLEQTCRRVSLSVRPDRISVVLNRAHERFYGQLLDDTPSQNLVIQPCNRDTAPAILYSLLRLAQVDRSATVAVFPCDHYVSDDQRFMRHVDLAFAAVSSQPELAVLLGITPDGPETDYGWIEAGRALGTDPRPVFAVSRFWEKPSLGFAGSLWRRGCLWNSSVIVAQLPALLDLILAALPELFVAFGAIAPALGTDFEGLAVEVLYANLRARNFSHDVLTDHTSALAVLPVCGVEWSDLGDPHRVMSTLAQLGIQPAWQDKGDVV
ncbi:MAG: sugar phosphate nucleotidyltransferase [Candidatus Binataceae bacterium]